MAKFLFKVIVILSFSLMQAQADLFETHWDKAIENIKENSACIQEVFLGGYNLEPPPVTEITVDAKVIQVFYDHTFETLKQDYVWKMRDVGAFIIPLEHLKEARIEEEYLYLKLFNDYALHNNQQYLWSPSGNGYLYDPNSGTLKTDFIAFAVEDSEGSSRLLAALKEISCLARKYRKAK